MQEEALVGFGVRCAPNMNREVQRTAFGEWTWRVDG
jgi:hypothetical protein